MGPGHLWHGQGSNWFGGGEVEGGGALTNFLPLMTQGCQVFGSVTIVAGLICRWNKISQDAALIPQWMFNSQSIYVVSYLLVGCS